MEKYDVKIQGTYDYEFTTTSKDDIVVILQAIVDRLIEEGCRRNEIDFDPNEIYAGWWLVPHEVVFGGIYVQVESTDLDIEKIVNLVV